MNDSTNQQPVWSADLGDAGHTAAPPPPAGAPEPGQKRRAAWVYAAVAAGQRYHLRTKHPWLHNAINLGAALALLAAIVGVLEASRLLHPALYVPAAALAFGLLYFALFILVIHEASHGMFVLSRHKGRALFFNRLFGTLLAPVFAVDYRKHWEQGHLEHHVRPIEPTDPQRFSIPTGAELRARLLKTLFVPGYLFYERTIGRTRVSQGKSSSSKPTIVAFIAIWVTAVTLATLTWGGAAAFALFWGVPVVASFNLVKGGLEHGGPIGHEDDALFRSRTTLFFGRRLLMPFNITLHFEHHLNFSVPWYDLPAYRRDLAAIVPEAVWRDVENPSPLSQLSGRLGGLSPEARALTLPQA
ncbi:MAG: fatty acid desaturase [Deltaproteobacteria bacterium]|nr:fatty acid desaturase [Deltaproteobacteria bacterium]